MTATNKSDNVMKANEIPKKLYILFNNPHTVDYTKLNKRRYEEEVEYTRTDVFIENAWDWIQDNILSSNQQDKSILYYEQFKDYMKGE